MARLRLMLAIAVTACFFLRGSSGQNERTLTIAEGVADTCSEALAPLANGNFTILQDIVGELENQVITVPGGPGIVDILIFPTDNAFKAAFEKLGVTMEQALGDQELLKSVVGMHVTQAASIEATGAETLAKTSVAFVGSNGTSIKVQDFPGLVLSESAPNLVVQGPLNEAPIYGLVDCNAPTRANRKFVLYADQVLLPESPSEKPSLPSASGMKVGIALVFAMTFSLVVLI